MAKPEVRKWNAYALLNFEGEIQCVQFLDQADAGDDPIMRELGWSRIRVSITEAPSTTKESKGDE